jgi:hypothetical protein
VGAEIAHFSTPLPSNRNHHTAPPGGWFNPRTGNFQSYIETSEAGARQRTFLGSYATAEAAERAYNAAAVDLQGEFAFVNRPAEGAAV